MSHHSDRLFTCLRTDRPTIVNLLLQLKENVQWRARIAKEILDVFISYIKTEGAFGLDPNDAALKNDLSQCIRQFNTCDQEWKQTHQRLLDYCQQAEVYAYYVQALGDTQSDKRLPLDIHSAFLYAEFSKKNVYLWARNNVPAVENKGTAQLTCMEYIKHAAATATIHLLMPSLDNVSPVDNNADPNFQPVLLDSAALAHVYGTKLQDYKVLISLDLSSDLHPALFAPYTEALSEEEWAQIQQDSEVLPQTTLTLAPLTPVNFQAWPWLPDDEQLQSKQNNTELTDEWLADHLDVIYHTSTYLQRIFSEATTTEQTEILIDNKT